MKHYTMAVIVKGMKCFHAVYIRESYSTPDLQASRCTAGLCGKVTRAFPCNHPGCSWSRSVWVAC